jgi:hypothetical protein
LTVLLIKFAHTLHVPRQNLKFFVIVSVNHALKVLARLNVAITFVAITTMA